MSTWWPLQELSSWSLISMSCHCNWSDHRVCIDFICLLFKWVAVARTRGWDYSILVIADRWWSTRKPQPTAQIWMSVTLKWYTTHCPLMGCICATYEYNPWNRQQATERTQHTGRTKKWMEWNQYYTTPQQFHCAGGIINIPFYKHRKSDCGDKIILWLSYLHNGIS